MPEYSVGTKLISKFINDANWFKVLQISFSEVKDGNI